MKYSVSLIVSVLAFMILSAAIVCPVHASYVWGTDVKSYTSSVSQNFDTDHLNKDEVGLLTDFTYSVTKPDIQPYLTTSAAVSAFNTTVVNAGGILKYIDCDLQEIQVGGPGNLIKYNFVVHRCVIVGDPINWVAIAVIMALVTIALAILYKPAILKLFGVTWQESLGYDFGTFIVLGGLAIFGLVAWKLIDGYTKTRKHK